LPANPGSPGKWPLKRRERERERERESLEVISLSGLTAIDDLMNVIMTYVTEQIADIEMVTLTFDL